MCCGIYNIHKSDMKENNGIIIRMGEIEVYSFKVLHYTLSGIVFKGRL